MMNTAAKPFLKWAGGKGQLLSQLDQHLPKGISRIDFTYLEPFVGGGAMLFHTLQQNQFNSIQINCSLKVLFMQLKIIIVKK
jgi:DNA adenine methylase